MEKNKPVILIGIRVTRTLLLFFARRSQADPIRFSIVKPNSDFELVNKSLDFKLNNSVLNGELKRKHQSVNSEYFSNGRSKNDSFTQ